MSYAEAFDLIDAGEGRWDVQHHGTLLVAGQVLRTNAGFELLDWVDRPLGLFRAMDDALRHLHHLATAGAA